MLRNLCCISLPSLINTPSNFDYTEDDDMDMLGAHRPFNTLRLIENVLNIVALQHWAQTRVAAAIIVQRISIDYIVGIGIGPTGPELAPMFA